MLDYLAAYSDRGRYVTTDKGRLAKVLQETVGDILMNTPNGDIWGIEVKTEQSERYGNFFLETWSNFDQREGWLFTLRADVLAYYFLDTGRLYTVPMRRLQRWAMEKMADGTLRIHAFPEKGQRMRHQLNDTRGRCVPIDVVAREVGLRVHHPRGEWGCAGGIT